MKHHTAAPLRRLPAILGGACMLLASGVANATLIDLGDRTRDRNTGLEWLDISQSFGRSYNDVLGELGVGGLFDGFRHASLTELTTFWMNAGITGIGGEAIAANLDPVNALMALIGRSDENVSGINRALAIHGTSDGLGSHYLSVLATAVPPAIPNNTGRARTSPVLVDDDTVFLSQLTNQPVIGHWLVRQVPAPATWLLLLPGAFFVWRRHTAMAVCANGPVGKHGNVRQS